MLHNLQDLANVPNRKCTKLGCSVTHGIRLERDHDYQIGRFSKGFSVPENRIFNINFI
jgi:hypothetical protein